MATRIIRGRGVIPGIVEGEALVCPRSITGWGGIDPATGIITEYGSPHRGISIKGRILVIPGSRGSNGWSCYFGAARAAGAAPAGWLITRIDSSAGVACAVMKIPAIVDFAPGEDPCTCIATGDRVRMNGETGEVEIIREGIPYK
jgi:predicted aconitase with swiveling domain